MKMWKRFFAERRGVHTGKNIRSTLAAAGVTSQATSLFLSWMEMSTAPDSGELGFHEFCIIMIALRVAMNSVINEEEFSATIRRALASRTIEDSASASETVLTPEDVRDLLEEFKVVHPREHVIARHKTNVSSGRRLLEVKDRSGHDVHSPLAEAVMLVTAIENDNVYVRDDLTREQENVHITLLEFVRYFIELDIYQSHDPK
ncbi:hypothetical protein Pmar_PMAR011600 [Perkinsus marinus ATCC 50983]|uniref:Uncharacterized protein n=1 Tax=Perkinsus marinus (strain ATCC 50983 / TXsc) TaxID=423536 RepID=C5LC86_PERM5|nr:hypothetical protein Pmar_PMAR011600 [Perkinsus marinus ATCC 50983]EER05569.1 hypothetical protein Pmar_PMAR011600 [Perkinsus marinus ATCC 50983]|eukprot:XP_002773753.1 hypothetical protein Pmar_PMAR011600 [Perkinsus marinus ATCC 50983]